ncbi:MAG: sigma-70 family RNA polymerase sigma factor [Gemmatimonadaceae bacterium]|nr:sigma-70 family RNA polymerase sigma factor [Gemmatimonadaceae bacterium]
MPAARDAPDQRAEAWLVLRAQAGDRDALESLLRRIEPAAQRYIAGLTRASPDAEDVLQTVMLTVVRKITALRDPALFRPWLYRIASRESFRSLRAEREWRGLIDDGTAPDSMADSSELEDQLIRRIDVPSLVARLSLGSRTVVTLHYMEGLSLSEVATSLGLSVGTVKSRLAYALAQLRAGPAL